MRQNKLQLFVHLVWATWNREPFITDAIERELYRYIEATCHRHRCPVLAIGGTADHLHLLVELSNTISLDALLVYVKGGSSHFVNDRLLTDTVFKWQGNYGAFAVCPAHTDRVIAYIANQKRHHKEGTTWSDYEQTCVIVKRAPAQAGA